MKKSETNTTKKNWVLRIVPLALIFTLISISLLASTLARYTATRDGGDSARVAKFGVTIASIPGLFAKEYSTDPQAAIPYISVKASDTTNVVAPGTEGTAVGFSISGTPEVAVNITVAVDASSKLTGWTLDDGTPYEPVEWSIKKNNDTADTGLTFDELKAKLELLSTDYAPNTNLGTDTYTIGWKWPFNDSDAEDANDTYLGNKPEAPTIALNYTITVTQID